MSFTSRLGDRARAAARDLRESAEATIDQIGSEPPPTAVYARVADGRYLWLAATGTSGLRLTDGGADVTPPDDLPADRRGAADVAVRWDLSQLPGDGPAEYTVTTGTGDPVVPGDLRDPEPMKTPPYGRWQYEVLADPEGIRVTRTPRKPVCDVVALRGVGESIDIVMRDPGVDGDAVVEFAAKGAAHASVPTQREGDHLVARVSVEVVPEGVGTWRLRLVSGTQRWLLTRADNSLTRPGHATALPLLWSDDPDADDRTRVRFVYQEDAILRVKRPEASL